MKNKFLKSAIAISCIAATAIGATAFSACDNRDVLTVYTESGFAPFEYVSKGKIVGVDVDIMQQVADKLNMKLKFENVDFNSIIPAVSAGKLTNVGAAGLSVTEERQQLVDFSDVYYQADLYVIYQTSKATTYESTTTDSVTGVYWDSLAGKKIAVQTGTTADLFLGDELGEGGTIYGTGASAVKFSSLAVATNDIGLNSDVLIIDELPAKQLVAGKSNLKCSPLYYKGEDGKPDETASDSYAIAVTKGETEILNAINEVLRALGKDGIQALVNKHLGIK